MLSITSVLDLENVLETMVLCLLDAEDFNSVGRRILIEEFFYVFFPQKFLHFLTPCFLPRIDHTNLICHVKVVVLFFHAHPTGIREKKTI